MAGLPVAQLLSIGREPGFARLDVLCPYCQRVHHHQWLGAEARFTVIAPCSTSSDLRRYRLKMYPLPPNKRPARDDNAFDEPPPNWEE